MESIMQGAWRGLEPGLSTWLVATLGPALTKALEEASPTIGDVTVQTIQRAIPEVKSQLAVKAMVPYLILFGVWSVAMLAAMIVIARNTSRPRGEEG